MFQQQLKEGLLKRKFSLNNKNNLRGLNHRAQASSIKKREKKIRFKMTMMKNQNILKKHKLSKMLKSLKNTQLLTKISPICYRTL